MKRRELNRFGWLAKLLIVVLLISISLFTQRQAHLANAQSAPHIPTRTIEAVSALKRSQWQELESGIKFLTVATALGTNLTAIKISDKSFSFSVLQQSSKDGIWVSEGLQNRADILAVNGGFFAEEPTGKLVPVGMLVDDGSSKSDAWRVSGGFLSIPKSGKPDITLSRNGVPEGIHDAIQTKPVILEPGKKWAMNTNSNILKRRTIFCRLDQKTSLLLLVSGQGLSLFEAGWLLRSQKWGGFFDCDSAIALDGGGSTQLAVAGQPSLNIGGLTKVQNLLVVSRKREFASAPAQAGVTQ